MNSQALIFTGTSKHLCSKSRPHVWAYLSRACDAGNRVTQIKYYPTTANANANTSADETVTYTYDTGCGNAISSKGRLCKLADKSGTTTYSYDLLGRTTAKSQLVASLTKHGVRPCLLPYFLL
jgi:hypothetical protein